MHVEKELDWSSFQAADEVAAAAAEAAAAADDNYYTNLDHSDSNDVAVADVGYVVVAAAVVVYGDCLV